MDLGIAGRTALVLAGGGGLGGAMARSLAAEGARVAVADINLTAAQAVADEVNTNGGDAIAVHLDLAKPEGFDHALGTVESDLGSVDVLINNTGGPPPSLASGVEPHVWSQHFQSMVVGVIDLTDRVLPGMRGRGWGRIITSTSSGVLTPIPNLGISNVLRIALVGWSKTLSAEVASDGVTSNILVPGRIATARIHALDEARASREGTSVEEVMRASTNAIPVGRYGAPEEYAAVAAFLASQQSAYITGAVLRVDGGLIPSI